MDRRDILLMGVSAAALPTVATAAPSHLATTARAYATSSKFNGVILAGIGSRILYADGFGLADFASGRAMRPSAVFEGGSVSKWIATLVVLRLIDSGRLELRVPIATYLPDYRRDTGAILTLEHLMSHASGLPNQVIPALEADFDLYRKPIDQAEAVRRYASGDLQFAPGTRWQYSHSNWLIVQQIVEHVSGKPYRALARELIFAPCGLANSGIFSGLDVPSAELATSYKSADRSELRFIIGIPVFMEMIGGYYTDAADLFHLLDAVRAGRLLSPASRAELWKVRFPQQRYALGGRVNHIALGGGDRCLMEETGASLGYRTLAYGLCDGGETVVMLNNVALDSDDMDAPARALLAALAPG